MCIPPTKAVQTVVSHSYGSWSADIFALFHLMHDLKNAQMNIQRSPIQQIMFYEL